MLLRQDNRHGFIYIFIIYIYIYFFKNDKKEYGMLCNLQVTYPAHWQCNELAVTINLALLEVSGLTGL